MRRYSYAIQLSPLSWHGRRLADQLLRHEARRRGQKRGHISNDASANVSPSNGGEVDSAAYYYSRFADGRRLHERTVLRANKGADHLADPLRATLPARARRTTTSPGADGTRPIDEGQRARSPPPKGAEVA